MLDATTDAELRLLMGHTLARMEEHEQATAELTERLRSEHAASMRAIQAEHASAMRAMQAENAAAMRTMQAEHAAAVAGLVSEQQQTQTLRAEVNQLRARLAEHLHEQLASVSADVARLHGLLVLREGKDRKSVV